MVPCLTHKSLRRNVKIQLQSSKSTPSIYPRFRARFHKNNNMSFASKLFNRMKCHKRKLLSGATLLSSAVAVNALGKDKKDEVVFLSPEECAEPSKADFKINPSTLGEMRGPILPTGEVNWACSCIEHSVIGPCGPEFRRMRQFIHDMKYDRDSLSDEGKKEFDQVLEAYFFCTFEHPKYYQGEMLPEEKAEIEKLEEMKKLKEKERYEEWKKNFRHFGKDIVMFLPKEENAIPSTANIDVTEVEEFRAPLFPNGDLNWACTCIERDVVGPCNIEFRRFRQFIHNSKEAKYEEMSPEAQQAQADELSSIVRDFLGCCEKYPVYYQRYLKSDEVNIDENNSETD